jgi:hypothetical protein
VGIPTAKIPARLGDPPKFYLNNFWASYYKMLDKTLKKFHLGIIKN